MKWTPITERLPELTIHENEPFIGEWDNSEPVLVYHSDDKWECKYLVAQYSNGFADVGEPILYGWVDVNDGEEVKGVLAWMPLPEPYSKTEPQTCEECEHWSDTEDGCADRHGCKTEPQTEREGEWIYQDDDVFAGKYFCDNCDTQAEVDLYGEWILSNYCPNCGAKMKGADDE